MKRFQTILFFYSTVVSAVLLIGSFFFLPSPHNIIMLGLFLPITGFFWLALTNPDRVNANKWSIRMVTVLMLFMLSGTFAYWLSTKVVPKQTPVAESSDTSTKEILEQYLAKIEDLENKNDTMARKIDAIVAVPPANTDVLSATPEPKVDKYKLPDGFVMVNPNLKTANTNVFDSPNAGSKVAGTINPENKYPYFSKANGWYEIELENLEKAWVSDKYVVETQL